MSVQKNTLQKLSLEDWLLISACVKNDAQKTLEEFLKREDGLLGAAGTVGNKLRDLSEKIFQHAELLAKIDPFIMEKINQEKGHERKRGENA